MKHFNHWKNEDEHRSKMEVASFFLNNFEYVKKEHEKSMREWYNAYHKSKFFDRNFDITKRYFSTNLTLEEVAKEYGITRERVRQITAKHLRIAKHPFRRFLRLQNEKENQTV
jgi:DNA-directed RNA polymerase sigma subunit (sigma70/sigma32)